MCCKKLRPDDEAAAERQVRKRECLYGFRDFVNRINLPLYIKFTSFDAEIGAEMKK